MMAVLDYTATAARRNFCEAACINGSKFSLLHRG